MAYPPAHQEYRFVAAQKQFDLIEKSPSTDTLTVVCVVKDGGQTLQPPWQYDNLIFQVTITQPTAKRKTLSLLTLGVQAIDHEVIVYSAAAWTGTAPAVAPVTFGGPGDSSCATQIDLTKPPKGLVLTRAGVTTLKDNPRLQQVNDEGVWFVSFDGDKCVLEFEKANVRTKGARIGETVWARLGPYGDGHDNTPPI